MSSCAIVSDFQWRIVSVFDFKRDRDLNSSSSGSLKLMFSFISRTNLQGQESQDSQLDPDFVTHPFP